MAGKNVSRAAIAAFAREQTLASARLEGRVVRDGFRLTPTARRFVDSALAAKR